MQPLKIPPWMSLILAAVFNALAMLSLANIFTPGSKAAVAVMIVNAVLFNVLALLGVPIVGGKAVVNSVTVTTTQDPAPLPPPPSGPVSLKLLPFLLLAGSLSACSLTADDLRRGLTTADNLVSIASHTGATYQAQRNAVAAGQIKAGQLPAANDTLTSLQKYMVPFWIAMEAARSGLVEVGKAITAYEAGKRKDSAGLAIQIAAIIAEAQAAALRIGAEAH